MNWRAEAKRDLQTYPQRKEAVENIKEKIRILDEQFMSLRGISAGEPVMGGASKQEDKWLDNISERERLSFSLKIAEALVELTEKGLDVLDDREREILEGFYIQKIDNHVEKLCDRFNIEKSSLYRLKDEALRKFTISMFGTVEI